MKRPEGVSLIALYFYAMSIPSLIAACCLLTGAVTTGVSVQNFEFGVVAGITALVLVLILAFGLGIMFFITGLGLWGMRTWARWLAVVISILSLVAFPIGTIIGALTIWYLFKPEIRAAFEQAGEPEKPLIEEAIDEFEDLMEEPEPIEPDESEEEDAPEAPEAPEPPEAPQEPDAGEE